MQHLSGDAYEYIVAASGMTGSKLKYKAKLFPFGPIFAGVLCVIVIIGQDVDFIKTGNFDMNRFL